MAKNSVMRYTFDEVSRVQSWAFPAPIPAIEFTVPDHGLDDRDDSAFVHGFKQKIGDAAALDSGSTPAEKRAAMAAVVETLESGAWNAGRGAGDGGGGYLARAISEIRGKPLANVKAWLAGKTPKERAAVAADPEFAPKISELRKARVAGVAVPNVDEIPD